MCACNALIHAYKYMVAQYLYDLQVHVYTGALYGSLTPKNILKDSFFLKVFSLA